ncbi:MAG: DUF4838 domain-containing protein [Flavobacteriaceae bacterium]
MHWIQQSIFLIVLFFAIGSCQTKGLKIAEAGQSDFIIAYDSATNESALGAAQLLQRYLEEITAIKLPIQPVEIEKSNLNRIKVAISPNEVPTKESIQIKTDGENLLIYGGSEQSLQNAVYVFLEKFLNCRWYAPDTSIIPKEKKLVLSPIDYEYTPDVRVRTVHSKLFYNHPEFAAANRVNDTSFPFFVPEARVHTFQNFIPEHLYFDAHPEYYALRNGRRLPTQLCLTNPEVFSLVNEKVGALFDKYPEAEVISVSTNDNQQYCQCDQCSSIDEKEGSPAGTLIYFVNKIAANFPHKIISTLAYQYTRKPPRIKPRENVLITLCSIECDRSGPIEEKCTDFANDLRAWSTLASNVRIWDYTTQFTNFLAPFPNLYNLKDNIQLFRDNKSKWIFEQHSNNPSELFELRSYITAQLLWDPDQDFDALLKDFLEGYYKAAAPYVKAYINTIHNALNADDNFFLFLYGDPSQAFDSYLDPSLLEKYAQYFDQAEKAVANDSTLLNRVLTARLGVDFARLEASRKNFNARLRLIDSNVTGEKFINPSVDSLLASFEQTTNRNSIDLMNEMGYTVSEYLENYRSTIVEAMKPNMAKNKRVVSVTKPKKYAKEDPLVLTDGVMGGSSFYSNWLGYEGNNMEVILDLEMPTEIHTIDLSFLQVTNHIVFFPKFVTYSGSQDGETFWEIAKVKNKQPLNRKSKINAIQNYGVRCEEKQVRYLKITAQNTQTPYWHHAAGLPSWVFADEIIIN